MPYRVAGMDRVLEICIAPGTGVVTLGTALPGYRTFFSVLAANDTCNYFIEAVDDNGIPTGDATITILVSGNVVDASTAQSGDAISVKVTVPFNDVTWAPLFFFTSSSLDSETLVMMRQG